MTPGRAAADGGGARRFGRRPLQRVDDAFDVVIDVLLEIGVPDHLFAVDGLAVDHRRTLAVGAAEVEADPAAVEMSAELEPDLLRRRGLRIGTAGHGERVIVDFFADHGVIEFPRAVGRVNLRQLVDQFRSSSHGQLPAAARPEQELDDALDIAQGERRIVRRVRQNPGVEPRNAAVGPLHAERQVAAPGYRCGQPGVFPVPERRRDESRVELRHAFHHNINHENLLLTCRTAFNGTAPTRVHSQTPSCNTLSGSAPTRPPRRGSPPCSGEAEARCR